MRIKNVHYYYYYYYYYYILHLKTLYLPRSPEKKSSFLNPIRSYNPLVIHDFNTCFILHLDDLGRVY